MTLREKHPVSPERLSQGRFCKALVVSNVFISLMARVSHRLPVCVCVCVSVCIPCLLQRGENCTQKQLPVHLLPSSESHGMRRAACSGFGALLKRGAWAEGGSQYSPVVLMLKRMLNHFWITQDSKSVLLTSYKSQSVITRAGWERCFLPLRRMESAKESQG